MSAKNPFEPLQRNKGHLPEFSEFQAALEKTRKECPHLFKIQDLLFTVGSVLTALPRIPSFLDGGYITDRYSQSLTFASLLELRRNAHCSLYFCGCGLYKNAYHNIRYSLESLVQSSYLDLTHPNADFMTKIEILKEVEDLPEYRGIRLLSELQVPFKNEIKKELVDEYSRLSKRIHSTHNQFLKTVNDMMAGFSTVSLDYAEVANIYESMKMLCDIFLVMFINEFPEVKRHLTENKEFIKAVEDHNLLLFSKILKI